MENGTKEKLLKVFSFEENKDVVKRMLLETSDGNPGAIKVLADLIQMGDKGLEAFSILVWSGLKGSKIWEVYKDVFQKDMEKLIEHIFSIEKGAKQFFIDGF